MSKANPTRSQLVVKLLLSGEPVQVDSIKQHFVENGLDQVTYKISYYLLQAKHRGAIIKAYRQGKRVIAYQLINHKLFDEYGDYIKPKQTIKEPENV